MGANASNPLNADVAGLSMMTAAWQRRSGWYPCLLVLLLSPVFPAVAPGQEPSWATIDTRDGLPGDRVQALLKDPDGNLWIGTDRGVAVFPHQNQQGFVTSSRWIRTLTMKDGLAGDDVRAIAA